MNIKNYNNLLELFYNQYTKEKADQIFLKSLKSPNDKFSWRDTYLNILKLSYELKSLNNIFTFITIILLILFIIKK